MTEISIRRMTEIDFAFVLSTWLRHYKTNSYFASRIKPKIYFEWHEKIAKGILHRPTARCLIAYATDADPVIIAFLVYEETREGKVLHYCFTKNPFRRMGIMRKLFDTAQLKEAEFTHWTHDYDLLRKAEKIQGLTYNPYKL